MKLTLERKTPKHYSVGDLVKITKIGKFGSSICPWVPDMEKYDSIVATITGYSCKSISENKYIYRIEEDNGAWWWGGDCLQNMGKNIRIKVIKPKEDKLKSKYGIERVISNAPATIIMWWDGSKTVVKCQNDEPYDLEKGIALCFMKKKLGNKSNFNNVFTLIKESLGIKEDKVDISFVEEALSSTEDEVHVGDKVKIVSTAYLYSAPLKIGQIVTIKHIHGDTLSIEDEDGNDWAIGQKSVRKLNG